MEEKNGNPVLFSKEKLNNVEILIKIKNYGTFRFVQRDFF